MARRTLVDIDEKMIDAAIQIGGDEGINEITSRKIARMCDITDPLIFVHFGTMDNLLTIAYKKLCSDMLRAAQHLGVTGEEGNLKEKWPSIIAYFTNHPNLTKFLYNAIHSKYGMSVPEDFKEFFINIIVNSVNAFNPNTSIEDCRVFYYLTLESLLHFCVRIINGELEMNQNNLNIGYKVVFGGYNI